MGDLLPRQQTFDDLVTTILARFASSSTPEIDAHIEASLREIGEFVGVDYGFVIWFADDLATWSATHEWCASGVARNLENYQNIPFGTVPWAERVLLAGEAVVINSLKDTPPDATAERERWKSLGIKSTAHLPLRGPGGTVKGCVALNAIRREITWAEVDIKRLQLVGEAITNAIERIEVERELRQSETRFRATFEQAPVGILNVSNEGRVLRANQRLCNLLGYKLDELVGLFCRDLTHPDDRDASAKMYDDLVARRTSRGSLEKRYLRKDGGTVWGNVTLSLLSSETGKPNSIIAAVEDVTDRKQAEETFDAVPDLIFVLDRQHRIVRANREAAKRLKCDRASLLGRPCHEVIHGVSEAPTECLHAQVLKDGHEHRVETREPRLGGEFLISCTPIRDASGEVTGSVHVARDVTELKRSEAELRRAHEQLKQRRALAVAASLDGVWEWDAKSDVVQYSERFAELLGYTVDEIPQTLDFFRSALHPDDDTRVWTAVQDHLYHKAPFDVEYRLRTKEGDYRWFRAKGKAERDASGRATWMAGSLQDIHEQKTAEMGLRGALEEVQRLSDRLRAENVYLQEEISSSQGFDEIVGESEPLRLTLTKIEHVADTDASVLLLGETGTGKELFARAIHNRSRRKVRALVKTNLAALPSSLIESELFGHVKGAFTGAVSDKLGRFELADGGTLFLDEIGELDPELQTKLLRVLQEGEFERIGSGETKKVDVRVVAATNRNLHRAMEEGSFRPDLYYRLAVFPVEVPPLRLRPDDIPLLVWHFAAKKQRRLGKTITDVPPTVMQALVDYDWPGNVRELENVVERAMILSTGPNLTLDESFKLVQPARIASMAPVRQEIDRVQIVEVLEECHWKIKGVGNAAERLGLKPSTLRYRMKVLGIKRPAASAASEKRNAHNVQVSLKTCGKV